jgi:protein N-terminal methyltransferase
MFFTMFRQALRSTGLLVVKENVTSSNLVEVDKKDSSITRPRAELLKLFEKSGYKCIKEQRQYNMPEGIYPVYMFAIKPCDT